MAIDATIASNLAREAPGGAGPWGAAAGSRSEEEVIQSFQRSDFYKHEMAEFWDSGWKMFKRKAKELFPDLDFSNVRIDEDDVAQTPLEEGVDEEDFASSEDERWRQIRCVKICCCCFVCVDAPSGLMLQFGLDLCRFLI